MINKKTKKKMSIIILLIIILYGRVICFFPVITCSNFTANGNSGIAVQHEAVNFNMDNDRKLRELPSYNKNSDDIW